MREEVKEPLWKLSKRSYQQLLEEEGKIRVPLDHLEGTF